MAADDDILKLENQICFPLYAASRLVGQAYRPLLDALGITYPQYLVLIVLWEHDGATVSEIGNRLMLDSGTLTPVLKRLESQGLVKRRRSRADDRAVENWLSEKGRGLRARAIEIPMKLLCSASIELSQVLTLKAALEPFLGKLVAYHEGGAAEPATKPEAPRREAAPRAARRARVKRPTRAR